MNRFWQVLFYGILITAALGFYISRTEKKDRGHDNHSEADVQAGEDRVLPEFTRLDVQCACEVVFTEGPAYTVRIDAPGEMRNNIHAEVAGKTLKIYRDDWNIGDGGWIVHVSAPALQDIRLGGAAGFNAENALTHQDLDINLSGASRMTADIQAKNLSIDASGASHLELTGSVTDVTLSLSGSSTCDAVSLTTVNMDIDASGAAGAHVYVSGKLTAEASGAANVGYGGSPAHVSSDVSGAASMEAE